MKKAVFILIIITLLSKILGFGREITLAFFFGASSVSDAYLISLTIPTVIFAFIAVALKTTYIPIYSDILHSKGLKDANEFTNQVINYLLIISTCIVIIVICFPEFFVKIFASGFDSETLLLASQLTSITIFSVYFIGITYIYEAYLQVRKKFVIPALVGIPLNFIIIFSIILGSEVDYTILAWGQVVGIASQLLLLIPFTRRYGYSFKFVFNLKDKNIKKMVLLTFPVILGTSVDQINKLVDRTLASRIIDGGVSSLIYANKLNLFIIGIFVLTVSTVLFPHISKLAADKNIDRLKLIVSKSISVICIILIPIMVGTMLFAEQIVTMLYGRGAFSKEDIALTAGALFFYTVGMLGFGFREILSKVFYSLQDTKTPMINAIIGMLVNIVLNIVLSSYLGINGLALATSLAAIFTAVLLFFNLKRKIGNFDLKIIFTTFLKVVVASILTGTVSYVVFWSLLSYLSQNLSLIISIITAIVIYLIFIYLLKLKEVNILIKGLKNKNIL